MPSTPPIRVYADTSVYGGVFDVEFATASARFFDEVRNGRFTLVIGSPVRDEIDDAPAAVRSLFAEVAQLSQQADVSLDAIDLRDAYLAAQVVGEASTIDATHVALATLNRCDILVSWSFKHIVHRDKAPRYNAINTLKGLPNIGIYSPAEVVRYA